MGMVSIEGKEISLDDSIIAAGTSAIRMALSVDFPDLENADIQIVKPNGAPAMVTSRKATVVKRATTKG